MVKVAGDSFGNQYIVDEENNNALVLMESPRGTQIMREHHERTAKDRGDEPMPPEPTGQAEPPDKLPKKGEMAKNLTQAFGAWAKSGFRLVDDAEYDRRTAICAQCRFLVDRRCVKCGCFMEVKAKLAGMQCPASYW